MKEQKSQAGNPNEIGDGIQHHDLLFDKWKRWQLDVLMCGFHVAEVFEGGDVVRVLPNHVGQTNREGDRRCDPKPFGSEQLALWCRKQPGN